MLKKKIKKVKKGVDIFGICGILFAVMRDRMKNQHIDWLNAQDSKKVVAPVEGSHEGYRVVSAISVRDLQQHDFAGEDDFESPTHEDCGWRTSRPPWTRTAAGSVTKVFAKTNRNRPERFACNTARRSNRGPIFHAKSIRKKS